MTAPDVAGARAPRAWGNYFVTVVVLAVLARLAWGMAGNAAFEWPVVGTYLFAPAILRGLQVTLGLTCAGMVLGVLLGVPLAVARMSHSRLPRLLAAGYIWFFRGTPLLVQLIFWYNLATILPRISVGLPGLAPWRSWNTNDVVTPLTAAIAGLALNEAAYMAEIVRGGIVSVDSGQALAARAFGMTAARTLWRIILPQAMPAILPPAGNQLISMLKATSLVSVIAMADLLYAAQAVYNRTFQVIPLLLVAVLWYLLLTSGLNLVQSAIERHYGRGR